MDRKFINDLFDISGKVALITGAIGGLGAVAAKAFAAAGAKVLVTDINEPKLQELVKEIKDAGGEAAYAIGDVTSQEAVKGVVKTTIDTFGGIDILITVAGVSKVQPITDFTVEQWERIMDINVKGTWLFCKEVGQYMIERGKGGKVILIGSARGFLGMPGYSGYATSKGAVHLLAKTLGWEWGPHKINVNAIAPTVFRTALTQWMFDDDAAYKRFLVRIPIGRLGEPEDFLGSLILLSSKASDFITGAIIPVDGGYTAG